MDAPSEILKFHARLLKCTLEIESCRAYWKNKSVGSATTVDEAFSCHWFGAKSLARVQMLMQHLKWRYDRIPNALSVLSRWPEMDSDTRRLICHWHLQLSDPLYRYFTGHFLPSRIESGREIINKDVIVDWIESVNQNAWQVRTRIKFATTLLRGSREAGLVRASRDPITAQYCVVTDEAISYLIYLLREIEFEGTILDNAYLASVGLTSDHLELRLKALSAIAFRKQGQLVDFGWKYASLIEWFESEVSTADRNVMEAL